MPRRILWLYAVTSPLLFILITYFLGMVTPGYSHFANTISRLAVGPLGWIQECNFIQFALFCLALLPLVTSEFRAPQARRVWQRFCLICFGFWLIMITFPSDAFDVVKPADLLLASPHGLVHFSTLIVVFTVAPFGIHSLSHTMNYAPRLRALSPLTHTLGYFGLALCLGWLSLFTVNLLPSYLGILQKLIALVVLIWAELLLWRIKPNSPEKA